MIEKKFKAWDGKKMSKPFKLSDASYEGFPRPVVDDNGECRTDAEIIWLQWTGLVDKKGVEIYEGDIETFKGANYEVKWDEEWTMWSPMNREESSQCEVIGNIYQNKDIKYE